jgi:hypothetical protein
MRNEITVDFNMSLTSFHPPEKPYISDVHAAALFQMYPDRLGS